MRFFYLTFCVCCLPLFGTIEDHLRRCTNKPLDLNQTIEGVDYIYLINLDKRPERLKCSLNELKLYDIVPYRFAACDGSELGLETFIEMAMTYQSDMESCHWAKTIHGGQLDYLFLKKQMEKLPVYCEWMTAGALGCALSHLAVLQDAYESGYATIMILEDDIRVVQDPHLLTGLLKRLDLLTQNRWDLLYIDPTGIEIHPTPGEDHLWWMWRPDRCCYKTDHFAKREALSEEFIHVGSHSRTHAMILRRSGIEKILKHVKDHHLYLPIDHEIAFCDNIRLYVTSEVFVTYKDEPSDIKQAHVEAMDEDQSAWNIYKKEQLAKLSEFIGWCDLKKGHRLMDFIREHNPKRCVEIGTFGGSTTFPLIAAIKYQNQDPLVTIDAWDTKQALAGLRFDDPHYIWWKEQNLYQVFERFTDLLSKMNLKPWCTILSMDSQEAVFQFADESIDMLYIDGNFSSEGSLSDVQAYFPKVKTQGYIWLNNTTSKEKLPSVAYLMEQAIWLQDDSIGNTCLVFQKP